MGGARGVGQVSTYDHHVLNNYLSIQPMRVVHHLSIILGYIIQQFYY